jgi:hypothetical protein
MEGASEDEEGDISSYLMNIRKRKMNEKALDRTVTKTHFGRDY